MELMNYNQVGYVSITEEVLEDFWKNNKWFVPLQTLPHVYKGAIVYYGYCDKFRVLKEGEKVPEYILSCTRAEDGTVELHEAKEVK